MHSMALIGHTRSGEDNRRQTRCATSTEYPFSPASCIIRYARCEMIISGVGRRRLRPCPKSELVTAISEPSQARPRVLCAFIEAQRRALTDAGAEGISPRMLRASPCAEPSSTERGCRWIRGFPTEPLVFTNSFDATWFTQVHLEVSPQFPRRGGVSTFTPCAAWPPHRRDIPRRSQRPLARR